MGYLHDHHATNYSPDRFDHEGGEYTTSKTLVLRVSYLCHVKMVSANFWPFGTPNPVTAFHPGAA